MLPLLLVCWREPLSSAAYLAAILTEQDELRRRSVRFL